MKQSLIYLCPWVEKISCRAEGGVRGIEHKPARHQGFVLTTDQGHTLTGHRAQRSRDAPFATLDMQELT